MENQQKLQRSADFVCVCHWITRGIIRGGWRQLEFNCQEEHSIKLMLLLLIIMVCLRFIFKAILLTDAIMFILVRHSFLSLSNCSSISSLSLSNSALTRFFSWRAFDFISERSSCSFSISVWRSFNLLSCCSFSLFSCSWCSLSNFANTCN